MRYFLLLIFLSMVSIDICTSLSINASTETPIMIESNELIPEIINDRLKKDIKIPKIETINLMYEELSRNDLWPKDKQFMMKIAKDVALLTEATEQYQRTIRSIFVSSGIKDGVKKFIDVLEKEMPFLYRVAERALLDSWSIADDLSRHFANRTVSPKYVSEIQTTIKFFGRMTCKFAAANPLWIEPHLITKCDQIFSALV